MGGGGGGGDARAPPPGKDDEEISVPGASEEESPQGVRAATPPEIKHTEPIFLRSPRRVEENLAISHSFVRFREDGGAPPPRGLSSPVMKKSSLAAQGDELQVRLNAILRSGHRRSRDLRQSSRFSFEDDYAVSPPPLQSPSAYQYQLACDRLEPPRPLETTDSWIYYREPPSPQFSLKGDAVVDFSSSAQPSAAAVSTGGGGGGGGGGQGGGGACSHAPPGGCPGPQPEDQHPQANVPLYAKPPKYSIFTISGTLTDPFGTNAKYSLRSLSTAHF